MRAIQHALFFLPVSVNFQSGFFLLFTYVWFYPKSVDQCNGLFSNHIYDFNDFFVLYPSFKMLAKAGQFRTLCLSIEGSVQKPHHEIQSFLIDNKTFATLNAKENRATVKLSLAEQDVFVAATKGSIYPVPNAWGKKGWTHLDLNTCSEELMQACIFSAIEHIQTHKDKNKFKRD